jgi:hypothetical protein
MVIYGDYMIIMIMVIIMIQSYNPMVIYSNGDYPTRSCPILDIQKCSKKNHPQNVIPKKHWG